MIIAVFPGQGSQTPGFLAPWLDVPGVRGRLEAFSDLAGVDLIAAGTEWDADRIRDTAVAQPLIVAAGLVSWSALGDRVAGFGGTAGHSVGEIPALATAGVFTHYTAMRLVGVRGRAMAEAASHADTGMAAVLGGEQDAVLARLVELDLSAANYNGGGQLVVAGAREGLDALVAAPPAGTRVIPLQVAGAFHTRYMAEAVGALRAAAADVIPLDPGVALWTNSDGSRVADGGTAVALVVDQVANPVRWDLCMTSFAESGVTGLVEFTPAGTLTGLAKRGLKGVPAVALKTPDDLDAAAALLAA